MKVSHIISKMLFLDHMPIIIVSQSRKILEDSNRPLSAKLAQALLLILLLYMVSYIM